ncbi:periplasmic nitrate reductase, electron transfer subunit [Aliiroseovarius zhejiangensis]|uniref:Periplasmic nitrate reductase, electron transfer subunit n=1 Tax=Aliiroseovarius zhejiangensis TaxID=1632025 RepID=A0ABQ3IPW2_9RHOB|nr:nitrate reductase cytochrome c-type subunit [Aliiroseovarius zhejiangensis]GHE89809.1 periplasmic nitrate reductase, electron transfer subunit [Aliiroseovarius zhejiangensis]
MKKNILISAIVAPTLLATVAFAQSTGGISTLRGADVADPVAVEDVFHQDETRFARNYRQQPPLVPHSIDQYQIDLKANRCLSCHDWTVAGERKAPTLSMTHYLDREGNQMDTVAGTRWFCNQCHVPQADAPELVDNTFEPSN